METDAGFVATLTPKLAESTSWVGYEATSRLLRTMPATIEFSSACRKSGLPGSGRGDRGRWHRRGFRVSTKQGNAVRTVGCHRACKSLHPAVAATPPQESRFSLESIAIRRNPGRRVLSSGLALRYSIAAELHLSAGRDARVVEQSARQVSRGQDIEWGMMRRREGDRMRAVRIALARMCLSALRGSRNGAARRSQCDKSWRAHGCRLRDSRGRAQFSGCSESASCRMK